MMGKVQHVSDLASTNRNRVLRMLMNRDQLSRREISSRTGLAPSTVSNIVADLAEAGLIYTSGKRSHGSAGRKEEVISRAPRAAMCISVHYTTDAFTVSIVDFAYHVIRSSEIPVSFSSASELIETIGSAIRDVADDESSHPRFVSLSLPNHPFGRTQVARGIEEKVGIPTFSLNNVESMAMYYNHVGLKQRVPTFSLVYVGTGIGSALVLDGEVYQGTHGNASDLGHVHIRPSAIACRCGRTGCLETFASERALARLIRDAYGLDQTLHADALVQFLEDHVHDGDHRIPALLEIATRDLAKGIYNLVALSDPGRVVVVSRLNRLNPVFAELLRRDYYDQAREPAGARTELEFAAYLPEAGIVGAGIFGFKKFFGEVSL